jgi:hypothetical protein
MDFRFGFGSGGNSGTTPVRVSGFADFDFQNEDNTVVVTIANTDVTSGSFFGFSYMPVATNETTTDDFMLNGVSVNLENIIDNTSFDLRATAINNASGVYRVNYYIEI